MLSSRGVDGDKETCTHTAESTNNAWWMVDLEKESIVIKIEVTNRPLYKQSNGVWLSLASRLADFDIRVGLQRAYATNPFCSEHAGNTNAGYTSSHNCSYPIRGRYLYIDQKLSSTPLTVCEVVVYGYYIN